MKKFVVLVSRSVAALCLMACLWPAGVTAHILKQDHGIAAELHIPPDDKPLVGQLTTLEFSFGDIQDAFRLQDCHCSLIIMQNKRTVIRTDVHPATPSATLSSVVKARFPRPGSYTAELQGTANDHAFPSFQLEYPITVSAQPNHTAAKYFGLFGVCLAGIAAIVGKRYLHRRRSVT